MSIRIRWIIFLPFLGLALTAAPALAAFGGSYLVTAPTADVTRVNRWELGIHSYFNHPWIAEFRLGAAPNLQLGIDAVEDEGAGLNVKYRILPERGNDPALAIGLDDIGRDELSPFIVVSDRFPGSDFLRWHLGIGGGRYDGLFFGINADLGKAGRGGSPVSLVAEAVDGDLNLGVAVGFAPGWRLNFGAVGNEMLAGVTYSASF